MRSRHLLLTLLILSGIFVFLLVLLFVSGQKSNIDFNEGLASFERSSFKISQTSQQKEKAINEPVIFNNQGPNEPTHTDSSGKDPVAVLEEYQKNLDTTYLWGTYKPHLIHTFTQRLTKPLTFGFMYIATESSSDLFHSYRDVVEHHDNLFTEYLHHNGKNFSESIFKDDRISLSLNNFFFKEKVQENRQRWHSITTKEKSGSGFLNNNMSFIYYFIIEDFDGAEDDRYLEVNEAQGMIYVKRPDSDPLDYYKIVVYNNTKKAVDFKNVQKSIFVSSDREKRDTWRIEDILSGKMELNLTTKFKVIQNNYATQNERTNIVAVQISVDPYASFDIHIIHDNWDEFNDVKDNHNNIRRIIKHTENLFTPEYDKIFSMPIDDQRHKTCAVSALSNLLSGIGYYYGNIEIKDRTSTEPALPLYTGTPSKKVFPRGFLWDEGFHSLIYCKWNLDICVDVLKHWMNTQLEGGWIPREQLRGEECKSNGHKDYIKQIHNEANPPTLMFLTTALIEAHEKGELAPGAGEMLKTLYPKLKDWFYWFTTTQTSEKSDLIFAWKASNYRAGLVLGSGLDDYPRGWTGGSTPSGNLDLQIWIIFMAQNMVKMAEFVGESGDMENFSTMLDKVKIELHKFLDRRDNLYKDLIIKSDGQEGFSPHFGYVNLFPLYFGLLEKNSAELDKLLDEISDPAKLWSSFGLLSLSRQDPNYMATTNNYWGGPIWVHMNYLVLRGIKRYYSDNEKAMDLYEKLRNNLVTMVCGQKDRNHYFYEQYDQDNGKGKKGYPFTGWTTTALLMMYEKY